MYLNLTMEEALENEEFKKIINAASAKYAKYLDPDELASLQMFVLWKCLTKYKSDTNMKFTTYLYTQIGYAIKNLIKKNKKNPKPYGDSTYVVDDVQRSVAIYKSKTKRKIDQVLAISNEQDRKLLEQRYYHNMTIKEIGEANGYSKETARRKIQQAVKKCSVLI
jgi:RNA polymerase sigma factor (sigma-70 family)